MEEVLARLAAANIDFLTALELTTHFVVTRDGFVALIERREGGFGNIGAPGLLCERGVAQLIWRGEQAFFIARGFAEPATPEQIEALRRFGRDVKNSLASQ
ncbi:MAG: hypothetical protein K7J46_14285 [Bryobacter sp.]|nr:hypothetical protein [Bryobacter sp. CoA8 C33]